MGSVFSPKARIIAAISFIDTISSDPRFSGSEKSDLVMLPGTQHPPRDNCRQRRASRARTIDARRISSTPSSRTHRRMPSTQSSMKVKERVCLPSPHISNSVVAVSALRQNAAGAFSRPPVRPAPTSTISPPLSATTVPTHIGA
jgi:hypothetical protein